MLDAERDILERPKFFLTRLEAGCKSWPSESLFQRTHLANQAIPQGWVITGLVINPVFFPDMLNLDCRFCHRGLDGISKGSFVFAEVEDATDQ